MLTVREKHQRDENMRVGPEDNFESCKWKKKKFRLEHVDSKKSPDYQFIVFSNFSYHFFQSSSSAVGTVSVLSSSSCWQVAQDSSVLQSEVKIPQRDLRWSPGRESNMQGTFCVVEHPWVLELYFLQRWEKLIIFREVSINLIRHIWFYCD